MYTQSFIQYECGPLAQLVEQFPFKEWVDGSSPSGLTTFFILSLKLNNYKYLCY